MKNQSIVKNLSMFFVLAFLFSWILWLPSVLISQGIRIPGFLQILGQFSTWMPGLAAIIILIGSEGRQGVKSLFRNAWNWNFGKLWLIPILLLPASMILIAMAIKIPVEGISFSLGEIPAPLPIFIFILFFVGGPLEEFGWRGYALPRLLKRTSFLWAGIILGILHGLWHLPLHFMEGTVQSYIPVWEFIAVTTVGSIIYTWLFVNTKGSLTAMILHHWAANLASALLVYWDTSFGRWVFFGIQLIVAVILVIVYRDKKTEVTI